MGRSLGLRRFGESGEIEFDCSLTPRLTFCFLLLYVYDQGVYVMNRAANVVSSSIPKKSHITGYFLSPPHSIKKESNPDPQAPRLLGCHFHFHAPLQSHGHLLYSSPAAALLTIPSHPIDPLRPPLYPSITPSPSTPSHRFTFSASATSPPVTSLTNSGAASSTIT